MPARAVPALAGLLLAACLCPAQDDPAAAVGERLEKAKEEYRAELNKYRLAVRSWLVDREETARKDGNKKLVDQVKAAREAFEDNGEMPPTLPVAVRQPVAAARSRLDKAYTAAVKDYTRLKKDDAASATDKERDEFLFSSAPFGKRTYLATLKPSAVKAWNNLFETKGTRTGKPVTIDRKPAPHSIFIHPPSGGVAEVTYNLAGKWSLLLSGAGVPAPEEAGGLGSPLTFEVVGDGRSLWKSEPVTKFDDYQQCQAKVERVKLLTLRVHCPGDHTRDHAFWVEPVLVE